MLGFHAIPVLEGSPPLDGVHLQWSPTIAGCHAADGFSIWRRRTEYRPGRSCESLEDNQLNQLHQNRWLDFVSGEVFFTAEHKDWAEWSARFLETAVLSQKGGRRPVPYQLCLYHFRFQELRFGVDMQFQLPANFGQAPK